MEKSILRCAFTTDLLPEAVLWRRKEAFSDGISRAENSWFEMAKANGEIMNPNWSQTTYTVNPPKTAEAFWYRSIYSKCFPELAVSVTTPAMWMPRFINATDPSARTLKNYTV
jgi:asparagine synthase (glutamine-hydrolysing)